MQVDADALQAVAELLAQRKPDSSDSSPVRSVELRPYLFDCRFCERRYQRWLRSRYSKGTLQFGEYVKLGAQATVCDLLVRNGKENNVLAEG